MSCRQILLTNILFWLVKTSDLIDEYQRFWRYWFIDYQVLSWWWQFTKLHCPKFFTSLMLGVLELPHSNPLLEGALLNVRSVRFFSSTLNMYVPDSYEVCVSVYPKPRRTPIDIPKSTQRTTQTRRQQLIHTVHNYPCTRYTHTKPYMCNTIITVFCTNFITFYILIYRVRQKNVYTL